MKAKAFLFTKHKFINDKKILYSSEFEKVSILSCGATKKEAIERFVKRKKAKTWDNLKKYWVIKKVIVKIK